MERLDLPIVTRLSKDFSDFGWGDGLVGGLRFGDERAPKGQSCLDGFGR